MSKMTTALCIDHFLLRAVAIGMVKNDIVPVVLESFDDMNDEEKKIILKQIKAADEVEAEKRVVSSFTDKKNWKRGEKRKETLNSVDDIWFDNGEVDANTLSTYIGQDLVMRTFFMSEKLRDLVPVDIAIAVYTDPTDSKVVAWAMTQD